jgi:hypothetical protein
MSAGHCIRATLVTFGLAGAFPSGTEAQPPTREVLAAPGARFTVFIGGTPIGNEQTTVTRTSSGWTIVSSGRLGAPIDIVTRRLELRYTADWKPLEASIDATVRGQTQRVRTTVSGTVASNEITIAGQSTNKTDTVDPRAALLPSPFFGAYEAVTAQLRVLAEGATLPVYVPPQAALTLQVGESSTERIETPGRLIEARKTRVTISTPNVPLDLELLSDENGRLLRVSIPAQNLAVIRNDIVAVTARTVSISRPNDGQVRVPANGFTLAGTLSRPAAQAAGPLPAVVLTSGSGPMDRDGLAFDIPILGQLAGALADAGFLVLRYDKRGVGQSGGRIESAGLTDLADDLRAAVRFLADREDVDDKRIAIAGHSEGGLVSLLTASKEKRVAAVVLLATPGTSGAELVLEQQRHLLDRSGLPEADRQAKIDLQRQINEAVIAGNLETLPVDVRRQVDHTEFRSLLTTDPAAIVPKVRQPILVVQGELDTQVPPSHADRLGALARGRKKAAPVDVVKLPGVNHLLVPATTGEVDEYARLPDKQVSAEVASTVASWLEKTLAPPTRSGGPR